MWGVHQSPCTRLHLRVWRRRNHGYPLPPNLPARRLRCQQLNLLSVEEQLLRLLSQRRGYDMAGSISLSELSNSVLSACFGAISVHQDLRSWVTSLPTFY